MYSAKLFEVGISNFPITRLHAIVMKSDEPFRRTSPYVSQGGKLSSFRPDLFLG